MLKLILQFLVSGGVVVAAGEFARRSNTKFAGLIVAMPLLTLLTFIFLVADKQKIDMHNYLMSALVFMVPAAVFIIGLLLLYPRTGTVLSIVGSTVFFATSALVVEWLIKF